MSDYKFTVPNPVSKNRMKRVAIMPKRGGGSTGRIVHTKDGKAFRARIWEAADPLLCNAPISQGRWGIRCDVYWPRMRRSITPSVPMGDAGAVIEEVRDALEKGAYIDSDARIVENVSTTNYDKDNPRVEVRLWRLDG